MQAEEELMHLLGESVPATVAQLSKAYWLGAKADDGYTTVTPDTGVAMKCYTILEREY
jgi:hypothetical protein